MTGGAISISLVAVLGLLLLIAWRGLTYFWPAALAVWAVAFAVPRNWASRFVGGAGAALIAGAGLIVTYVVRTESPFPGAGWPIRFEWLHGWTLLGVVLLTVSTLFATDARHRSR